MMMLKSLTIYCTQNFFFALVSFAPGPTVYFFRQCFSLGHYLTIIPRARVGYEMIDSQRGAQRRVGYNHLISNKREWNNCFIKNNQEMLLYLADFAL